jgi:hypothetical protein
MTLEEWIAFYNRKNPHDPFVPTEGFDLYFREDKGFCEVRMTENTAMIAQLAGDARFFKDHVDEVARLLGVHEGGTCCVRRQIRAYIRLFGYRVERVEELGDGKRRYHCTHKETGKKGLVSPAFTYDETGEDAYYVTWEI